MAEIIKTIYDGSAEKGAMRDTFASTMRELLETDPNVVYLDADLMNSFGTVKLAQDIPDRCIDCGVAEANMMGVAAGMSSIGKKPYVHTFGPFASRRVFDQVFLSVGYSQNSVRIIGSDPGITAAFNGGTHMPFEDISLFRVIPQALVIDVTDSIQLAYFLKTTKDRLGVTYIRTPRKNSIAIYPEGTQFQEGKAKVLKDGDDVAIFACGIMVAQALAASKQLEAKGISAAVIDIVTVKPIDSECIKEYAQKCSAIVTAENANYLGGFGAAVCEVLSENQPTIVQRVGVEDLFGQVGPEDFLRKEYELTSDKIVEKAEKAISMK